MSPIRVEIADGIATVTIDRPAKRNALTLAMWQALGAVFDDFARDPAVRVAILTGAGGQFCAGSDISEFAAVRRNAEEGAVYERAVDRAADAIAGLDRPTIAAIDGFCIGGGCGLALACDLRWASTGAQFAITSAKVGLVYGHRETRNLVRAVGLSTAKRILFGGERFGAATALDFGMIDARVETEALPAAKALAAKIAENAPLSLAGSKRMLGMIMDRTDDPEAPELRAIMGRALQSEDYREGVAAFAAGRKPQFSGR